MTQTIHLYKQLDSSLNALAAQLNSENDAREEGTRGEVDEEKVLERDEIAKLLLLVARAFAFQHITLDQKSVIKNDIVRRKPYLRQIVMLDDISSIMNALKKISA